MLQLKDFFHQCSKREISEERLLLSRQREARRLQRDIRVAKLREAERERRRELLMQWYCRDMYLVKYRKSLKEWHKQRKLCEVRKSKEIMIIFMTVSRNTLKLLSYSSTATQFHSLQTRLPSSKGSI